MSSSESISQPDGFRRCGPIHFRGAVGAVLAASLLFTALACAPRSDDSDSRILVQFWHSMGGPEHQAVLSAFVREFEAENPDIRIQPVYQGNYGALSQKLIASVIARSNPPLAQMYEGWTARFLTRDLIDPVQNYLDGPDGMTQDELEDIWEPFRRNNSWDEKLVTLPFNKSCYVLYINKDMLTKAGFEKPPETWNELREAARRLTVRAEGRPEPSCYGFLMRSQIEAYSTFLFRAEENYLSGPNDDHVAINTPMAIRTLDFLRTLVVEDRTAYTDNTSYPPIPFGARQVAMYVHSSAAFPFNDRAAAGKFEWIAAPLPHPEGRQGGILFQGTNIGIFARPHGPEVRHAAWKFLKFITNTQNSARWSIATGYVVVRRSSLDTPEMKAFLDAHPNYRVPISLIPQATFDPRPHYWDQMRPQIANYAIEALNGSRTAEEAVGIIADTLQGIIDYEAR